MLSIVQRLVRKAIWKMTGLIRETKCFWKVLVERYKRSPARTSRSSNGSDWRQAARWRNERWNLNIWRLIIAVSNYRNQDRKAPSERTLRWRDRWRRQLWRKTSPRPRRRQLIPSSGKHCSETFLSLDRVSARSIDKDLPATASRSETL